MLETEQSRLELEAERGRRWAVGLEVWSEFIAGKREEVIGVLERPVSGDTNVPDLLATLRVLREFEKTADLRREGEDRRKEVEGEWLKGSRARSPRWKGGL